MVAVVVNRRRPQEFQRPAQAKQAEQADLFELDPLLSEINREYIVENAERKSFGEIEDSHPEELGFEQRFVHRCSSKRYTARSPNKFGSNLTRFPLRITTRSRIRTRCVAQKVSKSLIVHK